MSTLIILAKFIPFWIFGISLYWFNSNSITSTPYLLNNSIRDLKDENRCDPNIDCSLTDLSDITVIYERVNMENWEDNIENFSLQHGMTNRDEITISRESLGSLFDSKMYLFSMEHLHEDAEVRFIIEGGGYFDFRSKSDEWIRMHVVQEDLIFLPAGIYHRFTTDHSNSPRWQAVYRSAESEEMPIRKKYLQEIERNQASEDQ